MSGDALLGAKRSQAGVYPRAGLRVVRRSDRVGRGAKLNRGRLVHKICSGQVLQPNTKLIELYTAEQYISCWISLQREIQLCSSGTK